MTSARSPIFKDSIMTYQHTLGNQTYSFDSLKDLLARASSEKSGDALAGIARTRDCYILFVAKDTGPFGEDYTDLRWPLLYDAWRG